MKAPMLSIPLTLLTTPLAWLSTILKIPFLLVPIVPIIPPTFILTSLGALVAMFAFTKPFTIFALFAPPISPPTEFELEFSEIISPK